MHVVQLLPELHQGGVERGTVELNREVVRRGYQSTVVSAGGVLVREIERDGGRHVCVDVTSKNPLTVPFRIRALRTQLRALHPSILHARSRVPAWLCYLANRKLNLPYVTTVHGFNSVSPYSAIMTKGDAVICVSHPVKEYIQRHYHTPEEKITVIHRGIDPDEFNPAKLDRSWMDSFESKFDLRGKFIVTAIGRVTELKDYETFIAAAAASAGNIPNLCGMIVGGVRRDKRGYFAKLQALAGELGVGKRIVFAGTQDRMPEIYALSDVVVSCSKKPESFGRTLIEAMAMNTPVVATRHGGPLDIIEEGNTGFFFSAGEPSELAAVLLRQREISRADLRAYVLRHFSLEMMVEKTLGVYRKLL